MAKPSAAHSDDPVGRTTRRLRSQSAEPVESTRPGSRGRAATKTGAEDSATLTATATMTGQKRGRPKKGVAAAQELATVLEDDAVDEEAQQAQLQAQLQAQSDNEDSAAMDDGDPKRASTFSNMSGTTAQTSFSQSELAEMDSDVIIDILPSLAAASDNLARLLVPSDTGASAKTVWKEIRRGGSRHSKLHSNRIDSIAVHKPHFGSEEYIRPGIVIRAMLGTQDTNDVPPGLRHIDSVLLKINLVQMINNLFIYCDLDQWTMGMTNTLTRLAQAFPKSIAGDHFAMAALQVWLSLAEQLAIVELESRREAAQPFSAEVTIDSIFYDDFGVFRHLVAFGLDVASESIRKDAVMMVSEAVQKLKTPFQNSIGGGTAAAIVGKLKTQCPWSTLQDHAKQYFVARSGQLDGQVAQAGGIAHIVEEVAIEADRRASAKYAEEAKERLKANAAPRKSFGAKGSIALLKQRERRLSNQVPVEEPAAAEVEQRQVPHRFGSMLDPQPNAERVDLFFGDESQASPQPRRLPVQTQSRPPSSNAQGKRSRAQMEDEEGVPDPTQDDGFQTDTRDLTAANQRRSNIASSSARPDLHQRARTVEAGPSRSDLSSDRPSPAKQPRRNPGSAIPPPTQPPAVDDDELPASTLFARAKILAKHNRVTTAQAKPPQVRRPWTSDEEDSLIALIEEHCSDGISWSALKSIDAGLLDDAKLSRRSAEDIRFKARNMKLVLLLAHGVLPENFEYVPLDKKAKDKLDAHNIVYHQEPIRAVNRGTPLGD